MHDLTLDTRLINGSTLRKVLEQARSERDKAAAAVEKPGTGKVRRIKEYSHAQGRVRGIFIVLELLDLDPYKEEESHE